MFVLQTHCILHVLINFNNILSKVFYNVQRHARCVYVCYICNVYVKPKIHVFGIHAEMRTPQCTRDDLENTCAVAGGTLFALCIQ